MTDILNRIRAAFPPEGLFADKEWILSPEPLRISAELGEQLEKLGYRLNLFNRACNELYHRSVAGKQPAWIADYLDRGKPPVLVEFSRRKEFRQEVPRVIRPDLVLTEEGFTIAEIDSVPGGIGLTGWLNETYAGLGFDVVGGAAGMVDGFRAILGDAAEILVSQEAATYRPEMEWLARKTEGRLKVKSAENYTPPTAGKPATLYRFFELFDLPNIPGIQPTLDAAGRNAVHVTPPIKPYLEEKMWFALFWLRPLREFWRRELSERHFLELQKHIPYTWLLDPQPIPHHAVIPGLEINDWSELAGFGQKHRELILKISGFHETAWGSRSVVLGSDMPQTDWRASVEKALGDFSHHPHILQRFHKSRVLEHPYFDLGNGSVQTMRGRVRLCPYYFVIDGKAELRGALATICPPDKKLLHGMKDAILVPTMVQLAV
ncbi:MAG TPA: hypothetical protein VGH90_02290 [Chthoniobacteraceae bacterium]